MDKTKVFLEGLMKNENLFAANCYPLQKQRGLACGIEIETMYVDLAFSICVGALQFRVPKNVGGWVVTDRVPADTNELKIQQGRVQNMHRK